MDTPINPPLRLLAAFQQTYPNAAPEWIVSAPGREMWVAAHIETSGKFTLITPDLDGRTTFDRRSARTKRTTHNRPLPSWARFPAGVVLELSAKGLDLPGVRAIMAGEEPPGPRYDYAMGLVLAALCYEVNGQTYKPNTLIDLMERVRRTYIDN